MRTLIYLTPEDHARLTAQFLKTHPIKTEIDLIEEITGKPNLTHVWNEFALRVEVVEQVLQAKAPAVPF